MYTNNNVKLYSCSKNSKINSFVPYVDYMDAIKECDSKVNLYSYVERHPAATD